jgi:hypothetical protein
MLVTYYYNLWYLNIRGQRLVYTTTMIEYTSHGLVMLGRKLNLYGSSIKLSGLMPPTIHPIVELDCRQYYISINGNVSPDKQATY